MLTLYIEPQMTTDSHHSYELLPINIIVFLFLCFEQKLKKIKRNCAKIYQQNEDYKSVDIINKLNETWAAQVIINTRSKISQSDWNHFIKEAVAPKSQFLNQYMFFIFAFLLKTVSMINKQKICQKKL